MTTSELRALAERWRDAAALHKASDGATECGLWWDECTSRGAFLKAIDVEASPDRFLALLDANAAMVAALRQAAWHMGTDPDRNALVQAGHGWKTTSVEAADMIRAALALAEKQP